MNNEIDILPDSRNYTFMWVFFGLIAAAMPAVAIYRGEFMAIMFEQGAILASLFMLSFPAAIHLWGSSQHLYLGVSEITHKALEQFRFKRKTFKLSDIEGYKYESGVLVIKSKNGPYPKFPHGPFADLSGVILVPPIFLKDHGRIIDHLNNHGVQSW